MNTAGYLKFETKMDTNGFQKGINDITNKTKRGGGTIKNIVAGLGIAKLASMGINAIKSSLDGAISRIDTMNNFPKVMKSLGYSAEQASKSVKKLDEGVRGLPTSLDEIVKNTQLLTASLGDLDKGTETAVALNDMFLAGGQGAEAASRGLQQYNQMLAKGKVDQQSWNTLVEVAPGQLNQVAKSLLGASANQRDLYAALQSGKISMQEFNNEIIKLDKEGGKGFASFAEQARSATGGIATAIQNMRTAITRGTANIITSIDEALKDAGFDGIATYISNFGKKFEEALTGFGEFIRPILTDLLSGKISFQEAGNQIGGKIGELLSKGLSELMKRLPEIINSLLQFFMGAIEGLIPYLPQIITTLVQGLIDTLMMMLKNVDAMVDLAIQIMMALVEGLILALPVLIEATPTIIETLAENLMKNGPKIAYAGLKLMLMLVKGIWKAAPYIWAAAWKIVIGILEKFGLLSPKMAEKAREAVDKVKNWMLKLPGKIKKAFNEGGLLGVGKFLLEGLWKGINGAKDWILDKVSGLGKKIIKKIKDVLKIKSPSREMFAIGVNIDKGLIAGIDNTRKDVLKSASQLGQDVIDRMKGAVALETGNINANAMLKANANWNNVMVANIQVESDMYMDKTKVGQAVTPVVSKTLKKAGV